MTATGKMEILAIFNAKGGVGKTTSAVNLAACFAAMGRRTVVFDLDAQGNATTSLGVSKTPATGTYDVIVGKAAIKDTLTPTFMDGLFLVGATKNLATVDVDLALGEHKSGVIRQVIEPIADDFDILIMDCAPTFGSMTINALVSADAILIPTQPSPFAHDGLLRTWTILSRIRTELHPGLKTLGILPTFCNPNEVFGADGIHENEIMAAMKAEFGNQLHDIGIPMDTQTFTTAAAIGLPACVYAPESDAAGAYLDIAHRILGETPVTDAAPEIAGRIGEIPSRFHRFDDPPPANGNDKDRTRARLKAWQQIADEKGMLDARVNVPPVDGDALQQASYIPPDPGVDASASTWLSLSRAFILIGGALLLGTLAFLAGWVFGSGML